MLCCTKCFTDDSLREHIRSEGKKGDCDYCDSTDVACVMAFELEGMFEPLMHLYAPTNSLSGDWLSDLMDSDWQIFSENHLDPDKRQELLDEILNGNIDPMDRDTGAPVIDEYWRYSDSREIYYERAWDEFVKHIKTRRRFVLHNLHDQRPDDILDPASWLPILLDEIATVLEEGTKLYRARIGSRDPNKPFLPENMGLHIYKEQSYSPLGGVKVYRPRLSCQAINECLEGCTQWIYTEGVQNVEALEGGYREQSVPFVLTANKTWCNVGFLA